MKKAWTIIGVLLLSIGLVSISRSSVQKKENSMLVVNEVENQWTISGSFQKGENLRLYFVPHPEWSRPPYPPDGGETQYSKLFTVNITNIDANSYTLIEVILILLNTPPQEPYAYPLHIYSREVIHHGAITIEDYPTEINGIAKDDGLYLVKCSLDPIVVMGEDLRPRDASPPPTLTLYNVITETKHLYDFLLPVGASLSIVGIIVSIWGVKSKKRKTTRKSVRR